MQHGLQEGVVKGNMPKFLLGIGHCGLERH